MSTINKGNVSEHDKLKVGKILMRLGTEELTSATQHNLLSELTKFMSGYPSVHEFANDFDLNAHDETNQEGLWTIIDVPNDEAHRSVRFLITATHTAGTNKPMSGIPIKKKEE